MTNFPLYKFALREDLKDKSEFLPTRAEQYATGYDVRCAEPHGVLLLPGALGMISLGFRAICPEGWWYELKPRSSVFVKKGLHALYGTIDETYENELMFAARNLSQEAVRIDFGERVAQIIPVHRQTMLTIPISNEEFERLSNERAANRGGGFGSTGKV